MAELDLEPMGIPREEESVYRTLIREGRASMRQLSVFTGLTPDRTRKALRVLEDKGLASRSPGTHDYVPAPPDVALEALLMQSRQRLEASRSIVAELVHQYRSAVDQASQDLVEIVRGDAIRHRFEQLQHSAAREVIVIDKPPYVSYADGSNPIEVELLRRGVSYRVLYDRSVLELPGRLEWLERLAEAGEEARIIPDAPLKLAIADGKHGLVPLGVGNSEIRSGVLVHESSLLFSLRALFEKLWEGGVPATSKQAEPAPANPLSGEDRQLLKLLTAGVPDRAIARQLGVGPRTLSRRVSRIMSVLGATTRFQAGVLAKARGWT